MDEQPLQQSEPHPAARAEDEISDSELDAVAGGLARIWLGNATLVDGREVHTPSAARA